MTTLSHSSSIFDMDTSQDFDAPPDGHVTWVASQSTNPALQALMKEAEREKRTRPSTPVDEPMSWTYPLASTSPASVASAWHSSADSATYLIPPFGGSSTSSLAARASEPSISRRAKPPSAAQRKPLASSTSSAKPPLVASSRTRSSSHSAAQYIPQEEEPEAKAFLSLLKDVSRQLDENAQKKQRLARGAKEKARDLGRSRVDDRTSASARPLTKTSSASAICPVASSKSAPTPDTATSQHRGLALAKTSSLRGVDLASGKSAPTSLPSLRLNCNPKLTPAFNTPNTHPTAARKTTPESISNDGDCAMQDVIDLTETDTEWERPIFSRANTVSYMQIDDDDAYDDAMDMSFIQPDPPPQTRVAPPKPKPHPPPLQTNMASRPSAPTQRPRTGPPPLGMRRTPQLPVSQHNSTQGPRGMTAPLFKPPLLTNGGGTTTKNGSGMTRPTTTSTTSSRPPPRGATTKVAVAEMAARVSQDPDSSFDVSFDVDAEALEEAMKAYD